MDHVTVSSNAVKRALRNVGMQPGRLLVDVDQPVVAHEIQLDVGMEIQECRQQPVHQQREAGAGNADSKSTADPFSEAQDIGFHATATIKRTDFGITGMVWEQIVGDDVKLTIEAMFQHKKD